MGQNEAPVSGLCITFNRLSVSSFHFVWPSFSLAGIDVKMVKKMFKLSDAKRVRHWVFERLQVTLSGRRKRRRTLSIIMEELRLGRGIVRSKFSTGWSLVLNVKS